MTKGVPVKWQGSLQELVNDKDFVLFSNKWFEFRVEGTEKVARFPMLSRVLRPGEFKGIPGKDFLMEYLILNQSQTSIHTYYLCKPVMLAGIIWERRKAQKILKNRVIYKIRNTTAKMFVLLSSHNNEFSKLVANLIPELVASKRVIIPGLKPLRPG